MATVSQSAQWVSDHIDDRVTIAAHNSPHHLRHQHHTRHPRRAHHPVGFQGVQLRRINVDYASHSPQVDAHQHHITTALADIQPHPATIPMISTVTGQPVEGPELDADYWYTNLRHPVRFHQALTHLINEGHHTTIETSPHPVLTPAIEETSEATGTPSPPSTPSAATPPPPSPPPSPTPTPPAPPQLDGTAPTPTTTPHSPTYPFQHEHYWLDRPQLAAAVQPGVDVAGHPLLSAAVRLADGGVVLTGGLGPAAPEWVADHAVMGSVLLPGTAFVELAVRAGDEVGCGTLEELTLRAPLALLAPVAVQVVVEEAGARLGPQAGHGSIPPRVRLRPGRRLLDSARRRSAGDRRRPTEHR
ncbi:putative protein OS=Streptomyces griseorubiginosus OX=67304 GN=AQJ54_20050 PE=4 SV=1 [Streptomyces griseorubiginosus]